MSNDLRDPSTLTTLTAAELAEARKLLGEVQTRFEWARDFEPDVRELALIARAYKRLTKKDE